MKCLACGSTNLIEGAITDSGGSTGESFKPKDKSSFLAAFGYGVRKILNFACAHCGNLQFVVDFTDEDKQRYARFEGEQPNLLERISRSVDD